MNLKILEVKQNENGTCDVVFDYDDQYLEFVKESLGKEEPTEDEIAQFLSEAIHREIDRLSKEEEKE